jgi:RNA polymerase sigma factor (sigma-70 family)
MEDTIRKTPSELWESFLQNPGEEAFESLYDSTAPLVFTICHRILGNPEDAADAFQSTYTRLLAQARAGDRGDEPSVDRLVSRLAVREADAMRKRRNRRNRREVTMETLPPVQQAGPSAHQTASLQQIREKLEILLLALPDKLRLPVMLYYLDGMSQPQIAETLQVPVSTVSARIHKALKALAPLVRRAGLGESVTLFAALIGVGHLLSPPSSLAAGAVFAKAASALAAAGAAGAVIGGSTAAVFRV